MNKATTQIFEKSSIGSAWVAIICPQTENILLGKRAKQANNAGQWNLFGGGIEETETAPDSALRELREEAGIQAVASSLRKLGTASANMVVYMLQLTQVQVRRAIRVNRLEIEKVKWYSLDKLPENLHKSTAALLEIIERDKFSALSPAPSMRNMMDMVENKRS